MKLTKKMFGMTVALCFGVAMNVYGEDRYTNGDALKANATEGGVFLGTAIAGSSLQPHLNNVLTKTFFETEGLPTRIDDPLIEDIMKQTKGSKTGTMGLGSTGGGKLVIQLDGNSLRRMVQMDLLKDLPQEMSEKLKEIAQNVAGAGSDSLEVGVRVSEGASPKAVGSALEALGELKPSFENKTYNPRFLPGGYAGLEKELQVLRDAKVPVKKVTWQSFGKRSIPGVTSTVIAVDYAMAVERGVVSLFYFLRSTDRDYSLDKDYCDAGDKMCGGFGPGWIFNAADAHAPSLSDEELVKMIPKLKEDIEYTQSRIDRYRDGRTLWSDDRDRLAKLENSLGLKKSLLEKAEAIQN